MRKHLVWVMALALAIAVTSGAMAANTQKIVAKFSPSKLSKTNFKPGKISVTTSTGDPSDNDVAGALRARIYFDDDLKFFTKGIKICKKSQIENQPTETAKANCRGAQVGAGSAKVALGGDANAIVDATVTAFNGPPKNGKPVILLHAFQPDSGFASVLVGTLSRINQGDYGYLLDVRIEPLIGGSAITRFQTTVNRKFRFKGKRRSYVSGRCGDGNKKLNYKGTFNFDDGTKASDSHVQACTVA